VRINLQAGRILTEGRKFTRKQERKKRDRKADLFEQS
jgi:hypothetical protein